MTGGRCQTATYPDSSGTPFRLPYTLNEPDATFVLDHVLEEISGLTMSADGRHLWGVQDEDGLLFLLDRTDGSILDKHEFWKDGDYEGIETVEQDLYVVKSTGTLYRVIRPGQADQQVEKYNEFLDGDNDVEGLAYDKANNRLLLACKADAGLSPEEEAAKAIYAFNLSTMTMQRDPAYCIRKQDVQEYLNLTPALRNIEKIVDFFDPDDNDLGFSPSGIALHPRTGHLYILSSVGKLLMVLQPDGALLHIEKLNKDIHQQPEGICFASDGTLYISNEADGAEPVIHRLAQQHN